MFRSRRQLKITGFLTLGLYLGLLAIWGGLGSVWMESNFRILDFFYKRAIASQNGPAQSGKIVYLGITDASYQDFGKNYLDRADLARVDHALAQFAPRAVAYDILFPQPSRPDADAAFAASIRRLGCVYLPVGFALSPRPVAFRGEASVYRYSPQQPVEIGTGRPFYASRAVGQYVDFAAAAANSGHISAVSDPNGVYRHVPMVVRVDSLCFPTLALSMFLDFARVPFADVTIHWGREIVIPATGGSNLESALHIPIDARGQVFIPYPQPWGHDFPHLSAHRLLQYAGDEDMAGNLLDFFEDKFVLVMDVSVGTSDLGQTTLDADVPLVALHAALLNALFVDGFYRSWSFAQTMLLIAAIAALLGLSACVKHSWVVYVAGAVVLAGIPWLTWNQIVAFTLLPVSTLGLSAVAIFLGLISGLQISIAKDQAFIRRTFTHYVPEKVANQLLLDPQKVSRGGEEKEVTILFSDLAGFTSISERYKNEPQKVVSLLNAYFTEMTAIILQEEGIIDKYMGDAIMAEFGVPLPLPQHADQAVRAALRMQQRLPEMVQTWQRQGLPTLECRIGINTGNVVVGNMGSNTIFDYTVIGDAVNLAARLEQANKNYGSRILISECTFVQLTPGLFRTRLVDTITVKGKTEAVRVYEVLDFGENDELRMTN